MFWLRRRRRCFVFYNEDEKHSIIGTWSGTLTTSEGDTYTEDYFFKEDGTYVYTSSKYSESISGTYEYDGNQLTLWQDSDSQNVSSKWIVQYNLEGYDIILTLNDDSQTIFKGYEIVDYQ